MQQRRGTPVRGRVIVRFSGEQSSRDRAQLSTSSSIERMDVARLGYNLTQRSIT